MKRVWANRVRPRPPPDYGDVSGWPRCIVYGFDYTNGAMLSERRVAVLLLLLRSVSAYLLVVSDTDSPGLVLFDGGTPFYDRPARRYALNTDKSGDFVSKLLRVDHYTGSVILERPLECDGFKYPDVFTFYVDSTSNDTLEYMSIPLRMVIKGCEKNSEFGGIPVRLHSSCFYCFQNVTIAYSRKSSIIRFALFRRHSIRGFSIILVR